VIFALALKGGMELEAAAELTRNAKAAFAAART
jgi:hypothetical protein